jgi:acetylornithine deacetylase/succinyl-diaminopimelate desuccinylase-like protein
MERGTPKFTLTTHTDVVPGGPPPSHTAERIVGRGACDAKGQIVAQLWGLQKAVEKGVKDYRCAYVVGEEVDAIGARELMLLPKTPYILNGEPTRGRFVSRSWGAMSVEITASGTEAHSSLGTEDSAIHKLVEDLSAVLVDVPEGISINVGTIQGGTAANIQAGEASCSLTVRIRAASGPAVELIKTRVRNSEWVEKSPPIEGLELFVPNFERERDVEVRFASDCSVYAEGYDKVLLFGPGDISEAHTEQESIGRAELRDASETICRLIMEIESERLA